jgi:mycoredoxin
MSVLAHTARYPLGGWTRFALAGRIPSMTAAPTPDTAAVTMFTTTWCGYCVRLKKLMQREGIDFAEVDIEQDERAADLVMQANGGNRTVPTLLFTDGTALTNPSIDQVKAQLGRLSEA